jgi:heme/copper-type cytochrome/quinol oxidase subunit 4
MSNLLNSHHADLDKNQTQAIIVFVLYSGLTLLNFYYLATRILHLKQNNFHIMMFSLLQLCYLCFIAEKALNWIDWQLVNNENKTDR